MTQPTEEKIKETEEKDKNTDPVDLSSEEMKRTYKPVSSSEILELSMNFSEYSPLFYNAWVLGNPVTTESDKIPTAAVMFDYKGRALYYIFNEKFWRKLNKTEKMFVFAHEILHVFLDHGQNRRDVSGNHRTSNVAMDLVINHLLLDRFGFKRDRLTHLSKMLCWVDTIFKPEENVEIGRSFEHYYNLLKDRNFDSTIYLILSGCPTGIDVTKILEEQLGQQLPNSVKEKLKDQLKNFNQQAGNTAGSLMFPLDPNEKVVKRVTWQTLITSVLAKSYAEKFVDRWMPRNRRIQHLSPDIFMPSQVEDETIDKNRPQLWVFADTSGSCYEEAHRFFRALKSIPPEKFNIRGFGFDTSVYEVNFRNPNFTGFGGTSFSVVVDFINKKTKNERPPDLVFVFTDGYGDFCNPENPKRWHWFLTPRGSRDLIPKESHVHELEAFFDERNPES